jgi:hypothetical protein
LSHGESYDRLFARYYNEEMEMVRRKPVWSQAEAELRAFLIKKARDRAHRRAVKEAGEH